MSFLRKPYYSPDGDGGTGGTPPDAAAVAAETQEFENLSAKAEAELTVEEKTKLEGLKGKYQTQYVGPDGKALTDAEVAAIKEVQTKVDGILAKEEAKRTPEEIKYLAENTTEQEEEKSLYQQVDELKGETLDIDYGKVDPNSAEGIVLRENTIAERTAMAVQENIKAKYPDAFRLMEHLARGGKTEDFYKPENKDFLSVKLSKEDKGQQEQILRTALEIKGNSPEIIDAVLTAVKDKATLFETASKELEALQNNQKQRTTQEQQAARIAADKQAKDEDAFVDSLETKVEKGFDGIVIPIPDRQKFAKFVAERISYQDGNFISTKRIDPAQLDKELKIAYFEYKGGDIKALAERTAKTQKVVMLKKQLKATVVPKGTAAKVSGYIPMGSV